MNILFIKGNTLFSKAIMGLTGEEVSHVALQFGRIIVHSNLLGLHLEWAHNFIKNHNVVYSLDSPVPIFTNDPKLDNLLNNYEYSAYDFGGLFYLGLCYLRNKLFKSPIPKKNLWQQTGMFLCTEWCTEYIDGKEDSTITPYKLYLELKNKNWTEPK